MAEISVIIPIYNAEKYLDDCIISVINNSIFNKCEIILIDDPQIIAKILFKNMSKSMTIFANIHILIAELAQHEIEESKKQKVSICFF